MTTKIKRMFRVATLEANKSKCNYRLGSVVIQRRKILARAFNTDKTHTLTNTDMYAEKWKGIHAEIAACLKVSKSQLEHADVYVVRIMKNGAMAMSRPCHICKAVLSRFGIQRVFYSISDDEYGVMEL